jgi:predicted RNase H-like nuclease (RuvC/YqgF family)
MKRFISGLLAIFGLASARRCDVLTDQVKQYRTAAHEWKARFSEASSRVKALESELKQTTQHAEKSQVYLTKLRARREEIDALRTRLADAERELMVAREHLMAIEVKLDILEGAANVLDLRTRAAISKRHTETSAPA